MRIANRETNEVPNMNEENAIRSAKLLKKIFEDNGLEYWFDYGALLGTIRGHKFIPWDTDIETYIYYEDDKVIGLLADMFRDYGLKVDVLPFNLEIYENDKYVSMCVSWFKKTELTRLLGIACYHIPNIIRKGIIHFMQEFYSKSTHDIIRPDAGAEREKKKLCLLVRYFSPIFFCGKLREAELYDFKVSVPAKAEELLFIRYGKDWKIPKKKYRSYTT